MSPTVIFPNSTDDAVRERREGLAQSIITDFKNHLSDVRLLCYFDDQDWQQFKNDCGTGHRGFYVALQPGPLDWPRRLLDHVFVPMQGTELAFDEVIYLHGSTCSTDVGLAMTFSHELQHAVQHRIFHNLWAANYLVTRSPKAIKSLSLNWCDFPYELEARLVSKRITERLFGVELVTAYIDQGISIANSLNDENDAVDWRCIRGLVTSTPYDLARETRLLFERLRPHRGELEEVLESFGSDPDFKDFELGAFF